MEEYEPIKVLGEGSFGKVYLMKHSKTRDLVCTKVRALFLLEGGTRGNDDILVIFSAKNRRRRVAAFGM